MVYIQEGIGVVSEIDEEDKDAQNLNHNID